MFFLNMKTICLDYAVPKDVSCQNIVDFLKKV